MAAGGGKIVYYYLLTDQISISLAELLVHNMKTTLQIAIKKVVEHGYSEELAQKVISRRVHYCVTEEDPVSSLVGDSLDFLEKATESDCLAEIEFDSLESTIDDAVMFMVRMLRNAKPGLSEEEAMWCLLICDMNLKKAFSMDESSSENTFQLKTDDQKSEMNNLNRNQDYDREGRKQKLGNRRCKIYDRQRPINHRSSGYKAVRMPVKNSKLGFDEKPISQLNSSVANLRASSLKPNKCQKKARFQNHEDSTSRTSDYHAGGQFAEKDELIMELASLGQIWQDELQYWIYWANKKVSQAFRRIREDQEELKRMRKEKKVAEEKQEQITEENMEILLNGYIDQVRKADFVLGKLRFAHAKLKGELEEAQELTNSAAIHKFDLERIREQIAMQKSHLLKNEKGLMRELFVSVKQKASQLLKDVERCKSLHDEFEAQWRQEEKARDYLLMQVASIRRKSDALEAQSKAEEEAIKQKVEILKQDIKKLEDELLQLRSRSTSLIIAEMKMGFEMNQGGRRSSSEETKQRECVICLAEEVCVVFLPCAHQIVCKACNKLHESQGMNECPTCRRLIQQRLLVNYFRIKDMGARVGALTGRFWGLM